MKENKMSRRQVVAGLGTTLAAVAVSPVLGGTTMEKTNYDGAAKISDPTKLYPKPPFKSQSQPWPGVQSKIDLVPDCGETSYKGSGRLMGRKALITGGDSGMGRAAAIAYAREGADVAINYYPTEEDDAKEVIALFRKEGRKGIILKPDPYPLMKRLLYLCFLCTTTAFAQQDILLSSYSYPFPVSYFELNSQHQALKMAYMDIKPQNPNGKVVVLLHGKNFNGAYWRTTIQSLTKYGYRVVAPDQVGFGKSSKPVGYQFTFQQLASNTKALLDQLGVQKIYLLGHSMGGMLATRFTLMYPDNVRKLVLEDPLGLEDWKRVAPYAPIDSSYQKEIKTDFAAAKKYQQENYYHGTWKPEYDEWAKLQAAWFGDPQYPTVAMANALTSDMIFTQPVVYELNLIKTPTLLIIGSLDRTAINKDLVKDPAVKAQMGQYTQLAKRAQEQIKGSQLVLLDGIGHLPHIEAFDRFIGPLEKFLD